MKEMQTLYVDIKNSQRIKNMDMTTMNSSSVKPNYKKKEGLKGIIVQSQAILCDTVYTCGAL